MKERPILFSGEMIRAILDNRKTQTRRVIKPQPPKLADGYSWAVDDGIMYARPDNPQKDPAASLCKSPYGKPGDRLWVRETFNPNFTGYRKPVYKADWSKIAAEFMPEPKWKPSIHMPRWASRITLEVTGIRVERVQKIVGADAVAEGIKLDFPGGHHGAYYRAVGEFRSLWNSINEKRGFGWDKNPWVWVVKFRRVQ